MPASTSDRDLSRVLRSAIVPLTGGSRDYDGLLDRVGDARFVLLGEASHGSHEFYVERARITRRLIEEKGFTAVAVEADWPDAYRVNRYVRGSGEDADGVSALADFHRFPMWMWRNADVLDFVEWLFEHNAQLTRSQEKTGFYGLDLYSLHASIQAVVGYLDKVDPNAARQARERYSCFDHVGRDSQAYGLAASLDVHESCEQEVVAQLVELQRRAAEYARRDGRIAEDEFFYAEQNARPGPQCRGVLPVDVPGAGLVVEPEGPAHGGDPVGADRAPGEDDGPAGEGGGVGAQLAPGGRAGHRDGR